MAKVLHYVKKTARTIALSVMLVIISAQMLGLGFNNARTTFALAVEELQLLRVELDPLCVKKTTLKIVPSAKQDTLLAVRQTRVCSLASRTHAQRAAFPLMQHTT
jgi:hypothetical protein